MIPLRDTAPSGHYPIVNTFIISINVLAFMIQSAWPGDPEHFFYLYGLVPARYSDPVTAAYYPFIMQIFSFFSFMFIHGGIWHMLSNMWFLYIFGDNVEDRLGHIRYLAFYILCGLGSALFHLIFNIDSNLPTIGASGAVAGVMGAYFILYPKAKILTLIPILFIPYFTEISAFFFLGLWLLLQFFNAAAEIGNHHAGGIAWWAHIGGFIFGILFLKIFNVMPETGMTRKVMPATERKKTHRFQVIRPTGSVDNPNLYGKIMVTSHEAFTGTVKLINIPWGFYQRPFRVTVPSHSHDGTILRLKGLGKQMSDGSVGDLMLTVIIRG